jgi:hypothetical protein
MLVMKTLLALLVVSAPLIACADESALNKLTPQEVSARLKQKNFYVYDNNAKERWQKSHVPGAKWLHPSEFEPKELPADKSATLVFYCANEH